MDREWSVFLITFSGIVASTVAGGLPQRSIEKLPLKRSSSKYIALTSGNGSRKVMIIYGGGVALDLEELAAILMYLPSLACVTLVLVAR